MPFPPMPGHTNGAINSINDNFRMDYTNARDMVDYPIDSTQLAHLSNHSNINIDNKQPADNKYSRIQNELDNVVNQIITISKNSF